MIQIKAYAVKSPIPYKVTENQNILLVKVPATAHPLPPVIEHATAPLGFNVKNPLKIKRAPAPKKSQCLCIDKGISQGKTETNEPTAAPPAITDKMAGSAQQRRVALEPNRLKKSTSFFHISFLPHLKEKPNTCHDNNICFKLVATEVLDYRYLYR